MAAIDDGTRLDLAVPGNGSTPTFDFVNNCFIDWISIDILAELLKFPIATYQNILAKTLPGNR